MHKNSGPQAETSLLLFLPTVSLYTFFFSFSSHPTPLVLLCDTVARGLIQRLIGHDQETSAQPADKGKSRGDRGTQKSNNVQADIQLNAMQNVQKAQEVCSGCVLMSSNPILLLLYITINLVFY